MSQHISPRETLGYSVIYSPMSPPFLLIIPIEWTLNNNFRVEPDEFDGTVMLYEKKLKAIGSR